MVNYQKYVDEIYDLILNNDINNIRIKEIGKEINKTSCCIKLSNLLIEQIGNEFLGDLYEIECQWEFLIK